LRLGLVLAFLLLFLLQLFLLFHVFLLQLLRLLLMLLLQLLLSTLIRLLLRDSRVFLLLLLLHSLPFLFLLCAELILLLLVLPVQLGIRGGLNSGPWRSRNLVRMDCRRGTRPIGLRWLRSVARTVGRTVSRTIGGRYRVRRCRPACGWIGIIRWRGPVWARCIRRDCLRGIIRCGRPVSRTIEGLYSSVTGIRRHLRGWTILRLAILRLARPVRL
jgi:hypothetical protein